MATDTTNTQTAVSPFNNRQYATHTEAGTYNGVEDQSPGWSLTWTAPATNVGTISFYAIGNAANGNNASFDTGDFVYRTNVTIAPVPEPDAFAIISCVVTCLGFVSYLRKGQPSESKLMLLAIFLAIIVGLSWSPTTMATPVMRDANSQVANTNANEAAFSTFAESDQFASEIVANAVRNSFPPMCGGFLVESAEK